MKFAACDGEFVVVQVEGFNLLACTGSLTSVTAQEVASAGALKPEEVTSLLDATLVLFATVFGFLVLRKVL
jgi:hypothetical protein